MRLARGLLAVVFVFPIACANETDSASTRAQSRSESPGVLGFGEPADPTMPSYPSAWRLASLGEAAAKTRFTLLISDSGPLAAVSPIAIYDMPGDAVAIDYSLLSEPTGYVRQQYIEIYEAAGPTQKDAEELWATDVSEDPDPSKSVVEVAGVATLVVEPYSPADDAQANPAFLRFAINETEVQISGGDDLPVLKEIAAALIEQSAA